MWAVDADGLTKRFPPRGFRRRTVDGKLAVEDLSFKIAAGERVGFLGPNGAGKSTSIKMLTGVLHPTSGTVLVDGLSPQNQRMRLSRRIGVVFGQRTQLWWDLPLQDTFRILRAMYGVEDAAWRERMKELTELLDLGGFLATPVRQLSLGQRMRGDLAAALVHGPSVLFLDEPTIGLDVIAKERIRRFLKAMNRERGTTIVLTTHDMTDVEEICERIISIDGGRKVFDGTVAELHAEVGVQTALRVTFRDAPDVTRLALEGLAVERTDDRTLFVQFDRAKVGAPRVLEELRQAGEIVDFSMEEPRLESIVRAFYG